MNPTTCRQCGAKFVNAPCLAIAEIVRDRTVFDVTGETLEIKGEDLMSFCSAAEAAAWAKRSPKTFVRWIEKNF